MKRYAMIRRRQADLAVTVAAYLPRNYKVIWSGEFCETDADVGTTVVVIEGTDPPHGGFGLDNYVIPRLGSGMMAAYEIDLSHPVMKVIPDMGVAIV